MCKFAGKSVLPSRESLMVSRRHTDRRISDAIHLATYRGGHWMRRLSKQTEHKIAYEMHDKLTCRSCAMLVAQARAHESNHVDQDCTIFSKGYQSVRIPQIASTYVWRCHVCARQQLRENPVLQVTSVSNGRTGILTLATIHVPARCRSVAAQVGALL